MPTFSTVPLKMATKRYGEELYQMTFLNLKDDICLDSAEQMCRHNVVSLLNVSGLQQNNAATACGIGGHFAVGSTFSEWMPTVHIVDV